jgi:C_GCAxxG_C_C family probable redox protein
MMDKNAIEAAADKAADLFERKECLCAEAVVRVVVEAKGPVPGLDSGLAPSLASAFCSGLSRTGGPCGALMGAVLAVNILSGRRDPTATAESYAELERCYAKARAVVQGFEKEFGSRDCTTLCGCDLTTDQGRQAFADTGAGVKCREFIRLGVRLVLEA